MATSIYAASQKPDVQHDMIKLESIWAHRLLLYCWDESSRMRTTLKNQIRIHGDVLDMQPGPADDGYCICVHYTKQMAVDAF